MTHLTVLKDGAVVPATGGASPVLPGFAITAAARALARVAFEQFLQWQSEGANLGDTGVCVVNIVADPTAWTATRGTGEFSNVITLAAVAAAPGPGPDPVCTSGPAWASVTAPVAATYQALACNSNGSVLIAAGKAVSPVNSVAMLRSTDFGQTWAAVVAPPSFAGPNPVQQGCLAYGNGVFVCSGSAVDVAVSSDGITWTVYSTRPIVVPDRIYFGGGQFVLVAAAVAAILTSTDGISWTTQTVPGGFGSGLQAAYGNGIHMVITSNYVITSPNAITWTGQGALPDAPGQYSDPAYGNGVWVVLSDSVLQYIMYSSNNGATWSRGNVIPTAAIRWTSVRFYKGLFYAISENGQQCVKSTDGINWTLGPSLPIAGKIWTYISDGAGRYAACGISANADTQMAVGVC